MNVCAMCLIFYCVNCVAVALECAMDNFLVHSYCTYIIRGRKHRGNIKLFRFKLQRTAVSPQHHHILTQQRHTSAPPLLHTATSPQHCHNATLPQCHITSAPRTATPIHTPHCHYTDTPQRRRTTLLRHHTIQPLRHTATPPHLLTAALPQRQTTALAHRPLSYRIVLRRRPAAAAAAVQ
jgi:hypothetical protein